jgi:hypothetical protein
MLHVRTSTSPDQLESYKDGRAHGLGAGDFGVILLFLG